MSKEYFSLDESVFNFETLDEAVEDYISNGEVVNIGDVLTLWYGTSKPINVKRYTPSIVDEMTNNAYDHMSEYASDFLNVDKNTENLIQTEVDNFIEGLLTRLDLLPTFYEVDDVKEVKVKITDVEAGTFDIVSKEF